MIFTTKSLKQNVVETFKLKEGYAAEAKRVWVFMWTRITALKILSTKSIVKKMQKRDLYC